MVIYRSSQARKQSSQEISWCSFLKNSISRLFFGSFSFKKCFSKSPCSELSSIILGACAVNLSSKCHSRGWAQLYFFSGIKQTYILFMSRLAWFLQCFHILSFSCQGLSNLFAWMNLKWLSFATKKYILLWSKWVVFLVFIMFGF